MLPAGRNLSTFCSGHETLQKTEVKGDELVNLVEEIIIQPSVQVVAKVPLAGFSQIYCENIGQSRYEIFFIFA